MKRKPAAPWDVYIDAVLSGRIVACEYVKAACRRHLTDLRDGPERGLRFDPGKAMHAIRFYTFLKHSKGEWAGQTVRLEPWQMFVQAMVFGWLREDGMRRFRIAYLEVARKNGKTTMIAGTGLYLMVADHEPGAEVYTAATKLDQARIMHSEATRMVKKSPDLLKRIKIYKNNLHIEGTASKYEPLGQDSETQDGLNVHGALVDEVHAHKTRDLWDVLETGMGSRRQPLMFGITTAGYNRQTLCYHLHDYTRKVLLGLFQDDSFFGIIFGLDEGDDWEDERNWVKANPNLGVSKKLERMREIAHKAKNMPSALNAFLRLDLNVWTQAASRWVPRQHWDACATPVNPEDLRGQICYGGLDLSSNTDLASLELVFPPKQDGDLYRIVSRFYCPEDAIDERSKHDRVPYRDWVRDGYLIATPGNVVDLNWIISDIKRFRDIYDFRELAFDRWGSTKLQGDIGELDPSGKFLVGFGQGYASMGPAMKDLERCVLKHQLAHGAHPVLNWCADNLVVASDPAGNLKPDKDKSTERIDGMVALVMGLNRAIMDRNPTSVYETRGFDST